MQVLPAKLDYYCVSHQLAKPVSYEPAPSTSSIHCPDRQKPGNLLTQDHSLKTKVYQTLEWPEYEKGVFCMTMWCYDPDRTDFWRWHFICHFIWHWTGSLLDQEHLKWPFLGGPCKRSVSIAPQCWQFCHSFCLTALCSPHTIRKLLLPLLAEEVTEAAKRGQKEQLTVAEEKQKC